MSSMEPMILELIDGSTTTGYGDLNVYVEHMDDGCVLLRGPLRFEVTGFVTDATWTLRHAWQDRTCPEYAFRLPEIRYCDPWSVVSIQSVMLAGASASNDEHAQGDDGEHDEHGQQGGVHA